MASTATRIGESWRRRETKRRRRPALLRRPRRRQSPPPAAQTEPQPSLLWEAASGVQCPPAAGQAPSSDVGRAPSNAVDAADDAAGEEESGPELEDELAERRWGRRPATRTSRRPRSESRPARLAPAGAAPGAREAEEDLTRHLAPWRIAQVPDWQQAELREIVRRAARPRHFLDNRTPWRRAAPGAQPWVIGERDGESEQTMVAALTAFCEPIPTMYELLRGIPHYNNRKRNKGELWNVVRALASKKVHYRRRLQEALGWGPGGGAASGAASGAPFRQAYPNAALDDGWSALTAEAFHRTLAATGMTNEDEYVKHLLNKHDGEVRHWGAPSWLPVPPDYVFALRHHRFWHFQFAKSGEVRRWLQDRCPRPGWKDALEWKDIDWVMQKEGGMTRLLRREPSSGGSHSAFFGGGHRQWYIKAGHHVTLAEMFSHGCQLCSCHFLYTLYLKQTIFVAKRREPTSDTEVGTKLQFAKEQLTEAYGGARGLLPWHSRGGRW